MVANFVPPPAPKTEAPERKRHMLEPTKDELRSTIAVLRDEKATALNNAQLATIAKDQAERYARFVSWTTPAALALVAILGYWLGRAA